MQLQQDEVLKMAKQAQVHEELCGEHFIYEFAKLVAEAEREACAKVCETRQAEWKKAGVWGHLDEFHKMAKAIRARGEA